MSLKEKIITFRTTPVIIWWLDSFCHIRGLSPNPLLKPSCPVYECVMYIANPWDRSSNLRVWKGLYFFFLFLGIEPRALPMLNRHSTTEPCQLIETSFKYPLAVCKFTGRKDRGDGNYHWMLVNFIKFLPGEAVQVMEVRGAAESPVFRARPQKDTEWDPVWK